MDNSWSDTAQAFTQAYGSNDLDASVLLMASYGFIEAKHPKYVSTVKSIERELSHNGLLFRYKNKVLAFTPKTKKIHQSIAQIKKFLIKNRGTRA